jgi:hypothetical protein
VRPLPSATPRLTGGAQVIERMLARLIQEVGEAALLALVKAILGDKDPTAAAKRAATAAAAKRSYRRG